MNAPSAGAVFFLCLVIGIVFDQVALGIIAGLILGGVVGKATAAKPSGDSAAPPGGDSAA